MIRDDQTTMCAIFVFTGSYECWAVFRNWLDSPALTRPDCTNLPLATIRQNPTQIFIEESRPGQYNHRRLFCIIRPLCGPVPEDIRCAHRDVTHVCIEPGTPEEILAKLRGDENFRKTIAESTPAATRSAAA